MIFTTDRTGRHAFPVYLDNAATSFPKPPSVLRAVEACLERYGGNPGRGSHRLALRAAEEVYACRVAAADMFGLSDPARVIFTQNTTAALNLAIKGILRRGERAVCSDMEHNAVFRPLFRLAGEGGISFDRFQTFSAVPERTDAMLLSSLEHALSRPTRLVVCAHASNICPATLPLAAIGRLCHAHGALFAVDAAQSAGILDINMEEMQIDALAVPGHKGLYGPMGVGMLLLGKGIRPDTLLEGGNGLDSLSGGMGDDLPERYEPGTLPLPAIAGLRAGIEFVRRVTPEAIREKETALGVFLRDALTELPGIHVAVPHLAGGNRAVSGRRRILRGHRRPIGCCRLRHLCAPRVSLCSAGTPDVGDSGGWCGPCLFRLVQHPPRCGATDPVAARRLTRAKRVKGRVRTRKTRQTD